MASQKFLDLIADPSANNIYLFTLTGYDPVLGTTVSAYHGIAGSAVVFASEPGDTPANTIFTPHVQACEWTEDQFGPDGAPGGRTVEATCRLRLINQERDLDWMKRVDWRRLRIQLGGDGFALSEFEDVFLGHGLGGSAGIEAVDGFLTLIFRDGQYRLNKDVQQTLYAGTGGYEGGPDLKDRKKPKLLGPGFNITPDFLGHVPTAAGAFLAAFRYHDGAAKPYDAAWHRFWVGGVPVERDASNPPAAGKVYWDDANGVVLFNGAISGEVTLDALGALGVDTLGDAVRYIAQCCGFSDPAEIDTDAFAQLDADLPAPVQHWMPRGGNALDHLDTLCGPLLVQFGVTPLGKLTVRQFQGPALTADLTLNDQQIAADPGLVEEETTPAAWRQFLGYARNWTIQDPGRLALTYTNAVTNGTFAVDANWTKGTGWSISAGLANAAAGSASSLTQDLTLLQGMPYRITITATRSAGAFQIRMEGVDLGSPIAAAGTHSRDFVAAGALNQTLEFAKDAAFVGSTDNVIVLPIRAEFVQAEFRTAKAEDAAIQTAIQEAGEDRRDTALVLLADAEAECARQFDLRKVERRRYRARCFVHPLAIGLGDTVEIAWPGDGLDEGKNVVLTGRTVGLPGGWVEAKFWG